MNVPKLLTRVTISRLLGSSSASLVEKIRKLGYQMLCFWASVSAVFRRRWRRAAEVQEHREDADHRGDDGQRPDRPVRRQVPAVQHAEVRGHLVVAAHGVGHPGARGDAGERGADQGQEDRECLDEHEPPAGRRLPKSQVPAITIMSPIGALEPAAVGSV